jgi:hypothetical protein
MLLTAAPPISIACIGCENEMVLISVQPAAERTVYAYECVNGHQHEIVVTDFGNRGAFPVWQ